MPQHYTYASHTSTAMEMRSIAGEESTVLFTIRYQAKHCLVRDRSFSTESHFQIFCVNNKQSLTVNTEKYQNHWSANKGQILEVSLTKNKRILNNNQNK